MKTTEEIAEALKAQIARLTASLEALTGSPHRRGRGKGASNRGKGKGRKMSAAARKRISQAQKARWAAKRKQA